jgi:PAS domain S-box-containing protein
MDERSSVISSQSGYACSPDFNRLMRLCSDAAYRYDPRLKSFHFFNDMIWVFLGQGSETGRCGCGLEEILQFVHPEDRPLIECPFGVAQQTANKSGEAVFRIIRPDGSLRWLSNRWIRSFVDPSDERSDFIEGFLQDQTRLHQADAQLILSKKRALIGSFIVQNGVFRYVNPEFVRLIGYSEQELLGRDSLAIVHEDYRQYVHQQAVTMLKGQNETPYMYCARDKQGGLHWALETVTAIELDGKRATLGYFMDITELRRTQEHLSSLGLMIGIISHSLKGCLVGVDAGMYLTESGFYRDMPARIEEGLDVLKLMIERIRRLVQDILYHTKERKPERAWTDLWQFASDLARSMETRIRAANIHFQNDLPRDIGQAYIDAERLRAAFINILENAMEACIEDPRPMDHSIRFSLRMDETNRSVRFEFSDNGPGIDPSELHKVFQLFYSSKGKKGTGIGLYLTRQVILDQGGSIRAESSPGEGARFTVTLPLQPVDSREDNVDRPTDPLR